jgi:hypothetical protein
MYTATIVRDLSNKHEHNVYHIRISQDPEPDVGGNVELVEVLHDDDPDKLEMEATLFVNQLPLIGRST